MTISQLYLPKPREAVGKYLRILAINDVYDLNNYPYVETVIKSLGLKKSGSFLFSVNQNDEQLNIPSTYLTSKNLDQLIKDEYTLISKEPSKDNFSFSLEAFGGASWIDRTLEAKTTNDNDLFQIRNENETPLEAIQLGVLFKTTFKSKWSISVGIQNTTMTERYQFKNIVTTVDSIEGIQELFINPYGDTTAMIGMIPRTTVMELDKRIYNTYRLTLVLTGMICLCSNIQTTQHGTLC